MAFTAIMLNFEEFKPKKCNVEFDRTRIKTILEGPLPAATAWQHMEPEGRSRLVRKAHEPKRGGVLIAFYPDKEEFYFPLFRRPIYEGAHSGQMAFPGGKAEPDDVDIVATALREADEEVGINPLSVEVLGRLSDLYIPVSHIVVTPVVAYLHDKPDFRLDPIEVDELFSIPLTQFLSEESKKQEVWELNGGHYQIPFYYLQEQKVWGATAMMLSELEFVLRESLKEKTAQKVACK